MKCPEGIVKIAKKGIINDVISREYDVDLGGIEPTSDLREDLGGDSLDSLNLLMALEEQFGKTIKDEKWQNVNKVKDIYPLFNDTE